MSNEVLIVKGAKVHNLKNIDCEISHNSLTVLTGVSGSGKSSLAFDTIYAEGQRRYIESLSAYARQFLERMEKPAVDEVMGIAPAIAIKQKNTEIYDYLRLLYARIGRTYCWQCHREVKKDILEDVVQFLLSFPEHTRIYVLFPFSSYRRMLELKETSAREKRKKKPANKEQEAVKAALSDLRKQGFNRLYQNKQIYELSTPESLLNLDFTAEIFVLVDRVAIQRDIRQRLMDSLECCYRESQGNTVVEVVALPESGITAEGKTTVPGLPLYKGYAVQLKPGDRFSFSEKFTCRECNITYEVPEPRLFSFNNPFGPMSGSPCQYIG